MGLESEEQCGSSRCSPGDRACVQHGEALSPPPLAHLLPLLTPVLSAPFFLLKPETLKAEPVRCLSILHLSSALNKDHKCSIDRNLFGRPANFWVRKPVFL